MRPQALLAVALAWQGSLVVNLGGPARPEHLHYQRHVAVADDRSGMACAVLDATVLSHTASPAHSDLRLFQQLPDQPEAEISYTLTESGPEPVADTTAHPEHIEVQGNHLSFDLRMPPRPFSEVRLRLALSNFVATATAEGRDERGDTKPLGRVPLFDLSAQHLGHWSSLLLGETSSPLLHLDLEVRTPSGAPRLDLKPEMVQDAEVPPSRLRQTRYVPTVRTTVFDQRGALTIAVLRVPAHVPVERVAFELDPSFTQNFSRGVTVSARPDRAPITDTEALDAGVIAQINLPSGDPRLYPISLREEAVDATLGATLARPATVLVAINNAAKPPLPLRAIVLEMRERKLCFFADREARYTLRYGDSALSAPVYDESALRVPAAALDATLGPEKENPHFIERREDRPVLKRHPEIFWLVVLLCGGMMGGSGLHHVQHRRS